MGGFHFKKYLNRCVINCIIIITKDYIRDKMATVRIDDNLLKEIKEWIKRNGNKYESPTVTSFINNAIYKKLKEVNNNGVKK